MRFDAWCPNRRTRRLTTATATTTTRAALVETPTPCHTLVSLACARCGARVVPCDACGGLASATARRCPRCAAARVEGDATRAAIGLDAVDAVDAIEAVEIALDGGWTREAYARAKREELARLETRGERRERAGRGDASVAPRRSSSSAPTLDDEGVHGTPDADLDERRLTLSSVQCGQRVVPESVFKTPKPSRFGPAHATVAASASPIGASEARVNANALDAAIVRVKSQLLFCEKATRKRRKTLEEYTWTDHEVLQVLLKRVKYDVASARQLMMISRSFLESRDRIHADVTYAQTLRTAIDTLERDVRLIIAGKDETREHDGDHRSLHLLWPDEQSETNTEAHALLSSALRARSSWADDQAREIGAEHSKRLREITRAQNDLLATITEGSCDQMTHDAACKAIYMVLRMYKTIFLLTEHARARTT